MGRNPPQRMRGSGCLGSWQVKAEPQEEEAATGRAGAAVVNASVSKTHHLPNTDIKSFFVSFSSLLNKRDYFFFPVSFFPLLT